MDKVWEYDGVNVCYDFDTRRAYGWSHAVKEGDFLRVPMVSGKNALLKFVNLKRCLEPKDQYFSDLEDIGYEVPDEK